MRIRGEDLGASDIRDVTEHPAYVLIRARLMKRREGLAKQLEIVQTWEEARNLQMSIRELDVAMHMPEQIISEMKKPKR